jgi:putative endonuclease
MPPWLEKLKSTLSRTPKPLGARGEDVACRFLRNLGYRIICRNFHCGMGEIDIVARDGKTLVFVEVKTRAYDDPTPEEQVNAAKMHQNTKAATFYLNQYEGDGPPARFDVVAVVWPQEGRPQVRHTIDAFAATF